MTLIKKLLFLLLTFFILDFILSQSLFYFAQHSKNRFSRLYHTKIDADLVFIGNSRAVNSFYAPYFTDQTKFKVINLAYNGLGLPLVKIFLDDYLERNKSPKFIFIEVTCIRKDYTSLLNFKQYINDSPGIKQLIQLKYPKVYYGGVLSKSFLLNSEFSLRSIYYLFQNDQSWINLYSIQEETYSNLMVKDFTMFDEIDLELFGQSLRSWIMLP